jgi:ATP-dependent Clp protease, protease subunit
MDDLKQNLIAQLLTSDSFESWNCFEPKFFGADSRQIPFFGSITQSSALLLISQLKHLEELNAEAPIVIVVNTEGGSVSDALAIYDTILQLSCPVIVQATGLCASAGLLILSAADYRIATPSTMFYYHHPIIEDSFITSVENMNQVRDYYEHCKTITDNIIRTRSKIRKNTWTKQFENKTSFYFDTKSALDFKIIDNITKSQKLEYTIEE